MIFAACLRIGEVRRRTHYSSTSSPACSCSISAIYPLCWSCPTSQRGGPGFDPTSTGVGACENKVTCSERSYAHCSMYRYVHPRTHICACVFHFHPLPLPPATLHRLRRLLAMAASSTLDLTFQNGRGTAVVQMEAGRRELQEKSQQIVGQLCQLAQRVRTEAMGQISF